MKQLVEGRYRVVMALAGRRMNAAEAHENRFPLHMKETAT
jgi:hypothetical protein